MELSPLTDWLSTLGPWGVIAALVVGFIAPKVIDAIRKKLPAPNGVPPVEPPTVGPVISGLIGAIRKRLKVVNPEADDEHELAAILARELSHGETCNPPDPPDAQ